MTDTSNGFSGSKTFNSWRRWVEPWYLAYALQGAVIAGLVPILLPLTVSQAGNAGDIGLVVAALSLGGLTAPLWGSLADRYRLHRWLLVGGLLITAVGLFFFTITAIPAVWIGLALFLGLGAAGTATVANLFVIEAHPKDEWDERIGWLQTFYGVGQVAGLLLAGILSQINFGVGVNLSAGLCLIAAGLGWLMTKTPPNPSDPKPVLLHPARHGEWVFSSPQRLFHHLGLKSLKKLIPSLRSPFGLFLLVWVLAMAGSAAFFSQYPVLMQKVFNIPPNISSAGFAIVAGLGLALYTPAGNWSEKYGSVRVIRTGLGLRSLAYIFLLGLGIIQLGFKNILAMFAFAVVVCAWSLISVSGTTLAAQLSPVGEGEGLGIFNATNALAGVIGAGLGGWVAGLWGYNLIAGVAVVGVLLGSGLSLLLPTPHTKPEQNG